MNFMISFSIGFSMMKKVLILPCSLFLLQVLVTGVPELFGVAISGGMTNTATMVKNIITPSSKFRSEYVANHSNIGRQN